MSRVSIHACCAVWRGWGLSCGQRWRHILVSARRNQGKTGGRPCVCEDMSSWSWKWHRLSAGCPAGHRRRRLL